MSREEKYLEHKKETLIKLVDIYNEQPFSTKPFLINHTDFNLEKTFCTPERCKDCGECCETFPCTFSPNDFLDINDLDYMRAILDTGIVCISKISTRNNYVLRVHGYADYPYVVSLTYDSILGNGYNPCLLNSKVGCLLPADYRPSEGLLYYRLENGEHLSMYNKYDFAKDYDSCQEVLEVLYREYRQREISKKMITDEENVKRFLKCMRGEN